MWALRQDAARQADQVVQRELPVAQQLLVGSIAGALAGEERMSQVLCATPNCFTYVLREGQTYCLACQLDRKMPQPALPYKPRGRPSQEVRHILECELALEDCERCERALMMSTKEEARKQLNEVWHLLEMKREGRR